jgi:hypothetical protein
LPGRAFECSHAFLEVSESFPGGCERRFPFQALSLERVGAHLQVAVDLFTQLGIQLAR